ncbi:uncharacterized protein LOC133896948 [Phragmites australis]|uniref:uncharacterized protein LOC133896948 n=1 Tax=Phragmites australis TaxID=29695 RepID=UPI002D797023|nr:uncharacterized protein LOC133896948 [Phragmites australis]
MSIIPQGEVARESGGGPFLYQQLTAANHTSWVIHLQSMKEDQGIWEAVEPAVGVAVDEKKDKKVRWQEKTSKEVWDCLKTRFVDADRVKNARLLMLKSDFNAMGMQEGESLDQYAGRLNSMSIRYANLGETLDDAALVKKLFDIVPDRFLSVIIGIEQFYDLRHSRKLWGGLRCLKNVHPAFTQAVWQTRQKKDCGNSSSSNKGKSHLAADSSNHNQGGHGRGRGMAEGAVLLNEEKLKPELRDTTEEGSSSEVWYLDNRASNHMTGDKEKFRELDEGVTGKVKFRDGSTVQIMGLGSVMFSYKNGDQWLLQEVYYISRLCSNIINLGQLTEVGHKVIMDAEHLHVYDNSPAWLLMKVRRTPNRLYKIELHQATLARQPFPTTASFRAKKPLELLHANLCGPITPSTLVGNSYFMLFVVDYSWWMWVFVIKSKEQACSMFRKFKFQLCEEVGIKRHLIVPYMPQQNGVVERRNRTVVAMARSLLNSMNVPGRFWGEAVRHTVYMLKRLPTKALDERTPFEAWNGRKPHLAHLRVFDCTAQAKATPLSSESSNTNEGPVRYRHIDDIMRDAPKVDLDGDIEEEAMLMETEEPSCYLEAARQQVWEDAMAKEIESIEKNDTWTLMTSPAGHKPIGLKWGNSANEGADLMERRPLKPFRYEFMWQRHEGYEDFVNQAWDPGMGYCDLQSISASLTSLQCSLRSWDRDVFGSVRKQCSHLRCELEMERSQTLYCGPTRREKDLMRQLSKVLAREETMEKQRSRTS